MRYRPGEAALVEASFESSELVAAAVEKEERKEPTIAERQGVTLIKEANHKAKHRLEDGSPEAVSKFIKEAAIFLGADDVGICDLDPGFVYSHRGRPAEDGHDDLHLALLGEEGLPQADAARLVVADVGPHSAHRRQSDDQDGDGKAHHTSGDRERVC